MTKFDPQFKLTVVFILLILAWGLNWPVSKIALHSISPLWFSAARLTIGTITMLAIVILLRKFIWPSKKDLKIILFIGLLQIASFMMLINYGLSHVAASRSSILVYTFPLWVVPISIFFFHETANWLKWLGFIFGMIGIIILFNPFTFDWSNHHTIIGNLALLLAALCWAISMLFARYMRWTRSPLQLIFWQLLVATIPVVLLAHHYQPHVHIVWNHAILWTLLYSGVIATAFGYWGGIVVSKEFSPITASLSFLCVPVCGVISSVIFLKEPLTFPLMLAMSFILMGIICVIVSKKHDSKKAILLSE